MDYTMFAPGAQDFWFNYSMDTAVVVSFTLRGGLSVRIKITNPKCITQFLISQVESLAGKFTYKSMCPSPFFRSFSC